MANENTNAEEATYECSIRKAKAVSGSKFSWSNGACTCKKSMTTQTDVAISELNACEAVAGLHSRMHTGLRLLRRSNIDEVPMPSSPLIEITGSHTVPACQKKKENSVTINELKQAPRWANLSVLPIVLPQKVQQHSNNRFSITSNFSEIGLCRSKSKRHQEAFLEWKQRKRHQCIQ